MDIEKLRFPIGKYVAPREITDFVLQQWIHEISMLPSELRNATRNLGEDQLNSHYRPGGWTLKQVIHHLADSHMNSYIRFKLAYTEENPTIRPYYEERWAECEEAKNADIEVSLRLLEALHNRWVLFMKSMGSESWNKTFYHPGNKQTMVLREVAGLYAWHGKHHLNHILMTSSTKTDTSLG